MRQFFNTVLYQPLYNLLVFFIWLVPGHSVGWAIIFLTILIRVILLPSSIKAAKATARLQILQPEINKIRKQIKDQQAQGKALMELYKKEGVSPFGSCLPLLIQLPILIILYRVFQAGIDISNFNMLYGFMPRPETINTHFLWFDLAKADPWILPIIAGASQFILSKMMTPPVPVETNSETESDPMALATKQMNKQMIYFFPLITVFFAHSLPAALSLYWVVTTIFGIFQQAYVNKSIRMNKAERDAAFSDAKEIEEEYKIEPVVSKPIESKKKDFLGAIMQKRLEKQEKKTGVEVTIRTKK